MPSKMTVNSEMNVNLDRACPAVAVAEDGFCTLCGMNHRTYTAKKLSGRKALEAKKAEWLRKAEEIHGVNARPASTGSVKPAQMSLALSDK